MAESWTTPRDKQSSIIKIVVCSPILAAREVSGDTVVVT